MRGVYLFDVYVPWWVFAVAMLGAAVAGWLLIWVRRT